MWELNPAPGVVLGLVVLRSLSLFTHSGFGGLFNIAHSVVRLVSAYQCAMDSEFRRISRRLIGMWLQP